MDRKLSEKIYKKDFTKKQIGYDAIEVDTYLDKINEEVIHLENELENANKKILQLEKDLSKKDADIASLQISLTTMKAGSSVRSNYIDGQSNVEVLKRISNLENMVADLKTLLENKSKDDRSF